MATPIVQLISNNVLTTLQGVTAANGYSITLNPREADEEGHRAADAESILELDDPEPADPAPVGHDQWRQGFQLLVFLIENEGSGTSPDDRINAAEADIRKALMVDPHRGTHPTTGGGLAVDTRFTGIERFPNAEPPCFILRFYALYRTLLDDPFNH